MKEDENCKSIIQNVIVQKEIKTSLHKETMIEFHFNRFFHSLSTVATYRCPCSIYRHDTSFSFSLDLV